MNCKSIQVQMHEYLDGEILHDEELQLKEHLRECTVCRQHLLELEKTIALVQSLPRVRSKSDFTSSVLAKIPKEQKRKALSIWLRKHPFAVAASLFVLLMFGSSMLSWYGDERQLQLSANATESHSLIIEDGQVVVPADKIIEGDLVVRHGNIHVQGEVKGNVVAIDGQVLLASTAHISGTHEEINNILAWMWYKIKSFGVAVVNP